MKQSRKVAGGTGTPMMKQYLAIKREHPDAILFFRMGDFYEMFMDDAVLAAEVLKIALTSRDKGKENSVPMCGIPYHAAQTYLTRLVQAGHKVAICDQVEDPSKAKGLVKREVTRIVTPGTVVEDTLLDAEEPSYLAAVHGSGNDYGISLVEVSTGEFLVAGFQGEQGRSGLLSTLAQYTPREILIPEGWEDADLPGHATRVEPYRFNRDAAEDLLKEFFNVKTIAGFGDQLDGLALGAAGAALWYLGDVHQGVLGHLRPARVISDEDTLVLDENALKNSLSSPSSRISDPTLRNRPVAVAPGHSERAPIRHISTEARLEGLFEGMPLFRARRQCPSLVILPPDPGRVSGGNRALIKLTREYSPVWEPSSTGRIYLDLTGSGRLFGPGRDVALKLERDLARRLDLVGWVGVAGNKLVSRIAAGYLNKPGVCDVLRGSEPEFIAPLPVTVIPGIGEIRQRILLADLNLSLVGQVASLTLPQLSLPFGPFAPLLFHRARGIDPSPVLPPRRTPMISSESLLDEGSNNDTVLLAELYRLAEECGLRLRSTGKAVTKLALTITHLDGLSRQRAVSLKDPIDRDAQIFPLVERLFNEASERRVGIKWMCLVCEGLTEPRGQLDMFASTGELCMEDNLQEALDTVRGRYGLTAVHWGRTAVRVQSPKSKVQRSKPQTSNLKPQTRTRS